MLRKDPFVTGEYYHLWNRGIDKRNIFKLQKDYERFMMLLYVTNNEDAIKLDNLVNILHKGYEEIMVIERGQRLVSIGAWCLMTNHFHLLVRQEVDGGITKFMRKLGTGYSMFFNIKYQRQGALFGGPFKSKCIKTDDSYMQQLLAYIHLNSLDIKFSGWEKEINKLSSSKSLKMKSFLDLYKYSSYLDYVGKNRVESNILSRDNFPDYFSEANSFKDFIEGYLVDTTS